MRGLMPYNDWGIRAGRSSVGQFRHTVATVMCLGPSRPAEQRPAGVPGAQSNFPADTFGRLSHPAPCQPAPPNRDGAFGTAGPVTN